MEKFVDQICGGWRATHVVFSLLLTMVLLAVAVPARAEPEEGSAGPAPAQQEGGGGEGGGLEAPATRFQPPLGETAPADAKSALPLSAEQPLPAVQPVQGEQPPQEGQSAAPFLPEAYLSAAPDTGLTPLTAGLADTTSPIIVPRSGGLPALEFSNRATNWMSGSIALGEYYDSNVLLRSDKREDYVTRVSPALAFRYENQFAQWSLGSSLDYRYYANNTRSEDFSYNLNTSGRINIYRDYAYVNVSDTYRQTSRSNAIDTTSYSSTQDLTDLNTLKVIPRLELPMSSRVRFNAQYTYTNYWYPSASQQNRENNGIAADVSYELSPGFVPALGYNYNRMRGNLSYVQQYPYLKAVYSHNLFTLDGVVGLSNLNSDQLLTTTSSTMMIWNVGITCQLPATSFTLRTANDVDQSSYNNATSTSSAGSRSPQVITSYTGTVSRDLRSARLTLALFFRENSDSDTSNLLTRSFGASGSVGHQLAARLSGSLSGRVERRDQRYYTSSFQGGIPLQVETQGIRSLVYRIGYDLSFSLGHEWNITGSYLYTNSSSPNIANSNTYNYTDNKVTLSLSKSFQ